MIRQRRRRRTSSSWLSLLLLFSIHKNTSHATTTTGDDTTTNNNGMTSIIPTFTDRLGNEQTCEWLGNRPFMQTHYCALTDVREACTRICNPCELDDVMDTIIGEGQPSKTCSWLNYRLKLDFDYYHSIHCAGTAARYCPHVCQLCDANHDGTMDTPSPTISPTPGPFLELPTTDDDDDAFLAPSSEETIDTATQPPGPLIVTPDNSCSVCGVGKHVTAPPGTKFADNLMDCDSLQTGGLMGAFPSCEEFPSLISEACQCAPIAPSSGMTFPPITSEPIEVVVEPPIAPVSPVAPVAAPTTPVPTSPRPTAFPTPDPTPLPTPNPTPDPTPQPTPNPTPDPTPAPPSLRPSEAVSYTSAFPVPPNVVMVPSSRPPTQEPTTMTTTTTPPPTSAVPSLRPSTSPSARPSDYTVEWQSMTSTLIQMKLRDTSYLNREAVQVWQNRTSVAIANEIRSQLLTDDIVTLEVQVTLTDQTLDTPIVIARMGDFRQLDGNRRNGNRRLDDDDDAKVLHLVFSVTIRLRSYTTKLDRRIMDESYIGGAFASIADQNDYVWKLRDTGIGAFKETLTVQVQFPPKDDDDGRGINNNPGAINRPPSPQEDDDSINIGLVAGLAGLGIGILGFGIMGIFYLRHRRSQRQIDAIDDDDDEERGRPRHRKKNKNHQRREPYPFQKKPSARIMNSTLMVDSRDDDISTIGDPFPPAMGEGPIQEDPTTAGSVSLPWDMQQQQQQDDYNSSNSSNSATSTMGGTATTSLGTHLTQRRNCMYVSEDDHTLEHQLYHHAEQIAQFDVLAPPGVLGLVLETASEGNIPVVHMVKPASPIADLVQVGDRLLRINGYDITSGDYDYKVLLQQEQDHPKTLTFGRGNKNNADDTKNDDDESIFVEEPIMMMEGEPQERKPASSSSFWHTAVWSPSSSPKNEHDTLQQQEEEEEEPNHNNISILDQLWTQRRPPRPTTTTTKQPTGEEEKENEMNFDEALENFDNLSI